MPNEYSVL